MNFLNIEPLLHLIAANQGSEYNAFCVLGHQLQMAQ